MIWGEVINAVRSLHLDLLDHSPAPLSDFAKDIPLTREGFPFPEAYGGYIDWHPVEFASLEIQEALEMHAVERVLLEGPLLPMQQIRLTQDSLTRLHDAILELELEWCRRSKLDSRENLEFIKSTFEKKWLKVKTLAGFNPLKAVST